MHFLIDSISTVSICHLWSCWAPFLIESQSIPIHTNTHCIPIYGNKNANSKENGIEPDARSVSPSAYTLCPLAPHCITWCYFCSSSWINVGIKVNVMVKRIKITPIIKMLIKSSERALYVSGKRRLKSIGFSDAETKERTNTNRTGGQQTQAAKTRQDKKIRCKCMN